jgi:hypothetical protein
MVDADLYDFLKVNETGLFKEKKSQEVRAYVHIDFIDLDKFVKIVGTGRFDEGGIEVRMFDKTICVELNEIFEDDGLDISDYKNCFGEYDEYFKAS